MNREPSLTSSIMCRERRHGYIYLFNLIIPVSFLAMFPLRMALFGGVMIVAFTSVYLLAFKVKHLKFVWVTLQILIMMAMMGFLNEAYIWMIFYPTACIALFFKRRHVLPMIGLMAAMIISQFYILSPAYKYGLSDWLMVLAAIVAGVVACYGVIWQEQTIRSREKLREANIQIERLTKIAERERISRDLHDVMGHELSMVTLKSQLVYRLIDRDPDRAKSEIQDIELAARQALTRVREYITDIRQPDLREEWNDAIKLLDAAGIACEADGRIIDSITSEESVHALAMCLREATTNLVRYSGAKNCQLQMYEDNGKLCLAICDNGIGVLSSDKGSTCDGGNGISGMRARVASVGGTLTLWSNGEPVGGTKSQKQSISPWKNGVALLIEVPCQISLHTEEVHG